jgi:hypothetical protein
VTRWLETGIVVQQKVALARQWRSKHVSVAADSDTTIDTVFSVCFMPRPYNKTNREMAVHKAGVE